MAPEITYILFEQVDGRPGESLVGEVERWRLRIYPKGITSAMLDPSGKWGFSGELVSQAADLSEAEVRWTEPGEQWVMGWFSLAGPGHPAFSVFRKVMVAYTPAAPTPIPTVPALVDPMGFPEMIPDQAFVSTVSENPDGSVNADGKRFLKQAAEFHREWDILVTRVGSFQEILEGVAKMGSATTLRIVSHALRFEVPEAPNMVVGMLELPMFRDAKIPRLNFIEREAASGSDTLLPPDRLLSALAKNEVALVETLLGYPIPADQEPEDGGGQLADLVVELVRAHVDGGEALDPFGLKESGRPTGAVRELVGRAVELAALKKSGLARPGITNQYDAVKFILHAGHEGSLRKRAAAQAGVKIGAVTKLENAIGTRVVVRAGQVEGKLSIRPGSLESSNTVALANAVRALLKRGPKSISSLIRDSRRVFRTPGRIDVRGCEIVGRKHGKPLLVAIRKIFDPAELAEISGAKMFQSYPRIHVALATEVGLDALAQDGAPEISEDFDWWAFFSGAIRRAGGILQWNSQPFPLRGISLLDMAVPVPILDRSGARPKAVMFALGTSIPQAGMTRDAAHRLLKAMWVKRGGSRPDELISRNLERWAEGQPPRTAVLTKEEHPDPSSAEQIYFQGDPRFAIDGIEILPPFSRGNARLEFKIR